MHRALIAIGVNNAGGLTPLQVAASGAQEMATWAAAHGIPPEHTVLLTDAKGPVDRKAVFTAVKRLIEDFGFIEQLIVYFAGHGINTGQGEQWLLSGAANDQNEAISLVSAEASARFGPFLHVVFISDACRTFAAGAQIGITGGSIFPLAAPSGAERPVDQFFAAHVGKPALEVRASGADSFQAPFTTELLRALGGGVSAVLTEFDGGRGLEPRRLKGHLAQAVPALIQTLKPGSAHSQTPDARITSDGIYLAEFPPLTAGVAPAAARKRGIRRRGAPSITGALPPPGVVAIARQRGLVGEGRDRLAAALNPVSADAKRRAAGRAPAAREAERRSPLDRAVTTARARTERASSGLDTGLVVRDSHAKAAWVSHGAEVSLSEGGRRLEVTLPPRVRAASILVQFGDGSATLAPVFARHVTQLGFDDDGLLDDLVVAAGGAAGRDGGGLTAPAADLRAVIAATASLGVLRVDQAHDAEALARQFDAMIVIEPGMAVHAAYAFFDARRYDVVAALGQRLQSRLKTRIFDLALLGREPDSCAVFPLVPMRTTGWPLVEPLGWRLPKELLALRRHLRPALWTHFESAALPLLKRALKLGR
jgi:hypothetical protein